MFLTVAFNPISLLFLLAFMILVIVFGWRIYKWFKTGMTKAYAELKEERGD